MKTVITYMKGSVTAETKKSVEAVLGNVAWLECQLVAGTGLEYPRVETLPERCCENCTNNI